MDEQKPFLLKIIFDDLPNKQKDQIDLLLTSVFITLFLLNTYLSFIVLSKVYDTIVNSYELANNYLNRGGFAPLRQNEYLIDQERN
jgi:TRAP-type mannitol/chloroaromatic compound transport system permease small subunit